MADFLFDLGSNYNYVIPTVYSNQPTNSNGQFLLLNNEILNDTFLVGFELLAASPGTINIQVINFFLYIYKKI